MKTVLGFTARLLVFAMLVVSAYSYRNVYSDPNISAANKDTVTKKGIALMGKEEVPAVAQSGYGTLDVSYDKASKTLKYTANWYGLSDSATMMHFHGPADKGKKAPVIYPITDFTPGRSGTATGTVKIDEVKLKEAELLGGKYYFNIHTKKHPGGEIRGQVEF